MERAFILDKLNTWYDWRLILTSKSITPPEVKTNYVELDGMSGSLDLSEALSGEPTYTDRTLSASFWTDEGNRNYRESLRQKITAQLHGKKIKIIEPDDPTHYFIGRISVIPGESNLAYMTFSIEATCEPWRYAIEESYRAIQVKSDVQKIVIVNNGVKTICPELIVDGNINLTFNDATITLTATGAYKITDLKLKAGSNVIGLSGEGSLIFKYREATL